MKDKQIYNLSVIIFIGFAVYVSISNLIRNEPINALLGPISLLFLLINPLAEKLLRVNFSYLVRAFVVIFCLLAFTFGTAMEWYMTIETYSWFVHSISGVLFTIIGFFLYFVVTGKKEVDVMKHPLLVLTYAIFFSAMVAVGWEIGEYIVYLITGRDLQHTADTGVVDTMLDIISCMGGTLIVTLNYIYSLLTKKKVFLVRMIDTFYQDNVKTESKIDHLENKVTTNHTISIEE